MCPRVLRGNHENKVVVRLNKTKIADNDFVTRSVKYWTNLTPEIQNEQTVASFKRSVKKCDFLEHIP